MRYFRILKGMIRMIVVSILSFGGIKFRFPVRLEKNASFSTRKTGKMILGKHVSINHNARIAVTENAQLKIGNYTGIGDNNVIVARERIVIGNNVMIGPNVCIYDHDHVFREQGVMRELGYNTAPVIIEDNVWIGAGVTILRGVTIGSGSVIGAGTIVSKNIPRNSLVYNKRELVVKARVEN
jgi:acetyltransferase-like isoleucine patch superfamily enzyme